MKNLAFAFACGLCIILSSCTKRGDCGCDPVDPIDSTTVNYAIQFNGENQYLNVPYGEDLGIAPTGSFTLETWVKPASVDGYHALLVKGNTDNESNFGMWDYGLYIDNGRFMAGLSWPNHEIYSESQIEPNKWYHVAATYNDGTWKLYVNGILEATKNGAHITQSDGNFAIARKGDASQNYFAGVLDNVRVWKTNRTQTEISMNMRKAITTQQTGLIASWTFDDGEGNTAHNFNQVTYPAALINQPVWIQSTAPSK